MEKTVLVSTIKTVIQVVKNLDDARRIYEKGLGLKCVSESETSVQEIGELWGISDEKFRIARFAREDEDFGCVDLVENKNAT
nr:hypothetical protein [Pyrinomonadaceae bacterium]